MTIKKQRSIISGRFKKSVNQDAASFSASHEVDRKLCTYDIKGSIAHANMLCKIGIIKKSEKNSIIKNLKKIQKEIEEGKFQFKDALEDIHMHVESRLTSLSGDAGKKLHSGRSRNDQVALDFTMYVKDSVTEIQTGLKSLLIVLLDKAIEHQDIFIPAFTHLQQAQVIRAAHHFLAYINKFARDFERFEDSLRRLEELPLGAGALAGTGLNNDRLMVAKELGFKYVSDNSLDTVSNRDFALEFLFNVSMISLHLSRFCEEIIIWFTSEFDYIELDEAFCTGSSLMPQKSNPDIAELIRGKTGRFIGNLINLFTTVKSLPLAYNRDLQEDKEALFDSKEQIITTVAVFTKMIKSLKFKEGILERQKDDYMLATDVAEYLVKNGMPFREAHDITGKIVRYAISKKIFLADLDLKKLQSFSKLFKKDIKDILTLKASPDAKNTIGSTSLKDIKRQIKGWQRRFKTVE